MSGCVQGYSVALKGVSGYVVTYNVTGTCVGRITQTPLLSATSFSWFCSQTT